MTSLFYYSHYEYELLNFYNIFIKHNFLSGLLVVGGHSSTKHQTTSRARSFSRGDRHGCLMNCDRMAVQPQPHPRPHVPELHHPPVLPGAPHGRRTTPYE
ncbi:MAG: hypothetical protein DSM106950_11375 [Stigonema ocellatum SAG 48.90 = DSM 106950]|nr:hypothetical protein [Stigonema ocellatum SAG 48.90 = DSM 106950]